MELGWILAIVYWIGYFISFTIVLAISAWAFVNDKELKKEGIGFSIFNMLLSLIAVPIFSWIFIVFLILSYYFINRKSN